MFNFSLFVLYLGSIVLTFSIFIPEANAASFDCKKAKSKTEIAICSDKELDELDSQLGSSYTELKKTYSADFFNKVIVRSQRQWIKNNSNNDIDTLKKNYRKRLHLLNTSAILVFGYKSFENKIDSIDPFIIKIQKDADGIEIISNDLFLVKKEIFTSSEETRLTPRCFTLNKLFRKSDGESLGFNEVFDKTKKNLIYDKILELALNQLKERGENVSKKEIIEEISQKLENDFNEVTINSKLFSINHFLSRPSECADTEISMPTKELAPFLTPYMKKQLNGFK
jgi:uncharacterized protein YecT (DUF1311 family)